MNVYRLFFLFLFFLNGGPLLVHELSKSGRLCAQSVVSIRPLTDRVIVVHVDEGSITYHGNGESTAGDVVSGVPLETVVADPFTTANFLIASTDDPNYTAPRSPVELNRKSKGTDFANFCEGWGLLELFQVNGCLNEGIIDHLQEHWVYLHLPVPLSAGRTYTFTAFPGTGLPNSTVSWKYAPEVVRSEAVHVNNVGYAPTARYKAGYVYHWLGDGGGLDLSDYANASFGLRDVNSGATVFTGKLRFRSAADNADTWRGDSLETPRQNFGGAEVYEGDFSAFDLPGEYVFYVEGIGASFPFTIGCDALRPAFQTVMKGLYHNRSGIELLPEYTDFPRPAPHHPQLTPGFAGRLVYSSYSTCDAQSDDANVSDRDDYDAGVRGVLDSTWGWYQDAGDWDAYQRHLEVPAKLLFVYEHYPDNFTDGELNLPESGNGLPDLLDEARWLIRFYKRVKDETEAKGWTTGGVPGGRIFGDLWGEDLPDNIGHGSWQDTDRRWVVSGEDPTTTYRYAALAAHYDWLLDRDGLTDPENIDWAAEARAAFNWAETRYDPTYTCHKNDVRDFRAHAAAALFRLTGSTAYDEAFRATRADETTSLTAGVSEIEAFGPWIYAVTAVGDEALRTDILTGVAAVADYILLTPAEQRGLRYGGNLLFPMLIGQGTTPYVFEGIMGEALLRESQPQKADDYRAVLHTTADYFLGSNPLNMTWVTGLGERSPIGVFDLDSRYTGNAYPKSGVIPYGPWRDNEVFFNHGPFNHRWSNKTLHPVIGRWPGHERWFDNRYAPLSGEYTVNQNTTNAAALYGVLAGTSDCRTPNNVSGAGPQVQSVRVYPNPTSNELRLELPPSLHRAEVRVFDSGGRLVRSVRLTEGVLSVADLVPGLYVLRLKSEGYVGTAKFVRQ